MNYYDLLEIDRDASQTEIEAAYRQKVKETHPDQSDHPNASQRFMRVKEAYDVLSDPERRAEYDEHGVSGGQNPPPSDPPESTTGDVTEGEGWRAYTRGSESAERMWEGEQRRSEKPPGVDDVGGVKATAGEVLSGLAGGVLGLEIALYLLSWTQSEPTGLLFTSGAGLFELLLLSAVFLAMLIGIEQLLGTPRKILPV